MKRINERVILMNDAEINGKARYVLYWMQMFKRVYTLSRFMLIARRMRALRSVILFARELRVL